ncbi:MAG: leucine-rich repeat domain-containing protein [Sedimentisphaerales bacterium]|nr:leucine-rich repeat domain-containing protein [Sedimentisphaerales bacterium]
MAPVRISLSVQAISLLIAICLASFTAQARYGEDTETPDDPVNFTDPILKALVGAQLGVTTPTVADMVFLKELNAAGRGISDLTGLEYATNLTSLNLGEFYYYWVWPPELRTNQIEDITPLSGLTRLKSLDLSNNQISDISALSGMAALETLTLYKNNITDITALSGLSNLTSLDLERNQITNISPLSGLTNLTLLELNSNPIADTSPLSMLTGLESLSLSRVGLTTIPELTDLPNLKFLDLVGNQITDISGLSGMSAIESVSLFGNRITSISALSDVPNLKALGLGINQIADISGLSGLTSLNIVDLTNNRITAIGELTDLPNLFYMDLQNNQITDISGLSSLPNLTIVYLNRNRIETLDALSDLPKLRYIEISTNQITDISGLSGMPSLESVDLSYNQIEAIPALSDLTNLMSMDLRNNRITDVAGLAGLADIEFLDLANNDIEDVTVLFGLTSIRSLRLSNNFIEDISALTSLQRLDLLDLLYNPLDEDAYVYNLPIIEANNPGMEIYYDPCPWAFERRPFDRAGDITQTPVLRWTAGAWAAVHDVYFGQDKELVANATIADTEIYRGWLGLDTVMYEPEALEWGTTYYWRIDEVNFITIEAEDGAEDVNEIVWKGRAWSFTTAEFIVIDDFELYTNNRDAGQAVFQTWIDGLGFSKPEPNSPGNGTGSIVGHDIWTQGTPYKTIAETGLVHGGRQSMPLYYKNADEPHYSQTDRTWPAPQDLTLNGMDTFELYFRGTSDNEPGQLYLSIEDDTGQIAVMTYPDPNAVFTEQWQKWSVPLVGLIADGVDVTAIRKVSIGVGDPDNPQPGGIGIIYIDDIRVIQL